MWGKCVSTVACCIAAPFSLWWNLIQEVLNTNCISTWKCTTQLPFQWSSKWAVKFVLANMNWITRCFRNLVKFCCRACSMLLPFLLLCSFWIKCNQRLLSLHPRLRLTDWNCSSCLPVVHSAASCHWASRAIACLTLPNCMTWAWLFVLALSVKVSALQFIAEATKYKLGRGGIQELWALWKRGQHTVL
jgi:hypothetical protein